MPSLDNRPIAAAERTVVVATALLADGRLLAAERLTPPAEGVRPGRGDGADGGLPVGLWELPGGKVEPGEDEGAAVVRECAEELALAVRPVERLGGAWPVGERYLLRVWLAVPEPGRVPGAGVVARPGVGKPGVGLPQPRLRVHRQHRWLSLDEVDGLAWLPSNRPLVRAVLRRLRSGPEVVAGPDPRPEPVRPAQRRMAVPSPAATDGMTPGAASVDQSSGFELI